MLTNQYLSPNSDVVIKQALVNLNSSNNGIILLGVSTNYLKHLSKVQNTKIFLKDLVGSKPSLSSNRLLLNNSGLDFKSSGQLFNNTLEDVTGNFGLKSDLTPLTHYNLSNTGLILSLTLSCRKILTTLTLFNITR